MEKIKTKNIVDLDVVDKVEETDNVLIERNGRVKKVSSTIIGTGGSSGGSSGGGGVFIVDVVPETEVNVTPIIPGGTTIDPTPALY